MDQKDYHFYDMDEQHTEGQALMDYDHDHDHGSSNAPNYFCALVAGVLAVLLLIVSMVLGWILFSRHTGSSINLVGAIMATLGLLFAALAAFIAFTLWKSGRTGLASNANVVFIVYIGAIFFSIFFLIYGLLIWVHKLAFSHLMQCSNSIPADWNDNFWGKNYDDAQLLFWRFHLILAIFSLLISLCFAVLASAAWHQLANKVQAKKITLGLGLIAVVVFGFLVVIWFQNHKATYHYIQAKLGPRLSYVPFVVFILGIVALGLAFLNAVFNFIRAKTLNFIFAAVWIGLFFVLAIFTALLFRNAYHLSEQRPFGRQEVASFLPEFQYKEYCGDKYLKANQVCGSAYLASTWDREQVAQGWLNPKCDCTASDTMLWPWFTLAALAAFLLAAVAIVIVSNFALASSEHDDDAYSAFHIFDVIALALIICLGIALGFWLGFRPTPVNNAYQHAKSGVWTDFKGKLVPNESFGNVPTAVAQNVQLKDQCYFLGKAVLPQFKASKDANAGYSVGVLVTNGRINSNYIGTDAKVGPKISRQYFFPNANNDKDDFVNIYGKYDDVTDALRNLVVCQSSLQVNHGVYLHANAMDLSKVNANGLTSGVAPTYVEPYPSGSNADVNAFTFPAGACVSSCIYTIVKPVSDYLNIRGTLIIKDANGNPVPYGVPEANLILNLYQNQHGREVYIGLGSYDANGNFLIQAPYIQNAAYKAVLHIDDKSGQYLSNKVDILVSPPNAFSDLNVGNVYLTTLSGKGCKQADLAATNNCFNTQQPQSAQVTLSLHDILNPNAPLNYPLTLTVRNSHSELGSVVSSETINSPNWTKTLPVGYYNFQVAGNGYNNNVQTVTLDKAQVVNAYLEEKVANGYRIYAAIDNTLEPNVDYDLNLKIRAADGTECVVNPINRVCAGATHIQSISQGQKGFEVIEVPQFTNAYYMVYVTKNQIPAGNCPYQNTTALRFLSQSKTNHMAEFLTNSAVRVFTSSFGGASPFGNSGASAASSYSAKADTTFNPINYGGSAVIPNLLAALAARNNKLPADQLFKEYVRDSDDAVLFGASMPILYDANSIEAQTAAITRNNNFPSKITSVFKSNLNNGVGNQTDSQNLVTAYVYNTIKSVNANQNEVIREANNLTPQSQFYPENGFDNIVNFMVPYGSFDDTVKQQIQQISTNQYNYGANNVVANTPPPAQEVVVVETPVIAANATANEFQEQPNVVITDSKEVNQAELDAQKAAEEAAAQEVANQAAAEAAAAQAAQDAAAQANQNANEVVIGDATEVPELPNNDSTQVNQSSDNTNIVVVEPVANQTTQTTTTEIDTTVTPNGGAAVNVNTPVVDNSTPQSIPIQVVEASAATNNGPAKYNDAVYTKTVNLDAEGNYPLDTSLIAAPVQTITTTTQDVVIVPEQSVVANQTTQETNVVQNTEAEVVPVISSQETQAEQPASVDQETTNQVVVNEQPASNDIVQSQEAIANATVLNHSDDLPVVPLATVEPNNQVVEVPANEVVEAPVEETVAPQETQNTVVEAPQEPVAPVVVEEPQQSQAVILPAPVEETNAAPVQNDAEVQQTVEANEPVVEPLVVQTPAVVETEQQTPVVIDNTAPVAVQTQVQEEPVQAANTQASAEVVADNNAAQAVVEQPQVVQTSSETTVHPDGSQTTTTTDADGAQTTSTTSSENEVIPDRRLKAGRKLQAIQQTYITQFCFTGFGEQSIKPFASSGAGVPSIQPCVEKYPDSDSYSLYNLKQATN